jgi:ribosomal protein L23
MGLFSSDKKKTVKKAAPAAKKVRKDLDGVLKAPWMSEKALIGSDKGIYVFAVPTDATKTDVAAAVEAFYKVTPRQVRMVNLPGKRKALRHKRGFGTRAARRKAYVYLKKGETITLA